MSKQEIDIIRFLKNNLQRTQIVEGELEEYKRQFKALEVQEYKDRSEIKTLRDIIKNQQKIINKQEEDVQKQKEDLKDQKNDLIQYFGLFVAIFTAISIDIQLLKFAQNAWTVAGLMLIVNTAPLFFFWLIKNFLEWDYITKKADEEYDGKKIKSLKTLFWNKLGVFIFIFTLIFGIGSALIQVGTKDNEPKTIIERVEVQTVENKETNKTEAVEKEMVVSEKQTTP